VNDKVYFLLLPLRKKFSMTENSIALEINHVSTSNSSLSSFTCDSCGAMRVELSHKA